MKKMFVVIFFLLFLGPIDLHAGFTVKKQEQQQEQEQTKEEPTTQDVVDLVMELVELQPALITAAAQGNVSDVNALLDKGENTEVRDVFFLSTPLMEASNNGHLEIVQLLLHANADVAALNDLGSTALMLAVHHSEIVQILLDKILADDNCIVTTRNQDGKTALMLATDLKDKETIKLLEEAEAKQSWKCEIQESFLDE